MTGRREGIIHMSNWNMGSEVHSDGSRDVVISFQNDDSNGQMSGTLVFQGDTYYINGNWAASGSVPGRNFSAFALWGTDQQGATQYVAVAGTMVGPGGAPQSIDLNLIRASTGNDQQYGWDGLLLPI
jgi:hypothetical protein